MPASLTMDLACCPQNVYNGWGHVINENKPISRLILSPDSLHESSITTVSYISMMIKANLQVPIKVS